MDDLRILSHAARDVVPRLRWGTNVHTGLQGSSCQLILVGTYLNGVATMFDPPATHEVGQLALL
jgi:hypothetical protein